MIGFERKRLNDMYDTHIKEVTRKQNNMFQHLSIDERWRIVTLHQDNNYLLRRIARMVNCSFSTLRRIIQLYEETHDVLEREGRGRRRLSNGTIRRHFRQIMSRRPTDTSASISDRLEQRTGVRISARTIRETRRNENYHPVDARVLR
jgi:transposase